MGKDSAIQWTHHTHNIVWGCAKVSEGCKNCYAEAWAKRTGRNVWGVGGDRKIMSPEYWRQPLKWNAAAERAGERRRVFCSSMADVFEDHSIVEVERAKLWPTIEQTPWLDWLLLTKRPQNVLRMVPWIGRWPGNVWIGTTVEDQQRADERIPHLATIPAFVRFLSCEPLLGPVDLSQAFTMRSTDMFQRRPGVVDWLIVGGESGPKARPFDIGWARSLVAQSRAVGVRPFVKQLGRRPYVVMDGVGEVRLNYADPKGGDWSQWPEDLRVREFPR